MAEADEAARTDIERDVDLGTKADLARGRNVMVV
jgi:hypothetical protein